MPAYTGRGVFHATCGVPGCEHRPSDPGCGITRAWNRRVLAAVSEGGCPFDHGRLEPADPPPTRPGDGQPLRQVVASGWCWSCGAQWTVGEDWWQWNLSIEGRRPLR